MQKLIILFSFIALYTTSQAQQIDLIETAFKTGNASGLSGQMAKEIELCIGDDVQFLSGAQAVQSLNKWFASVKPSAVSGKIVGGSAVKYYSGQVTSAKGSHKLFVYYNEKDGGYKIDEIRIGVK